MARTKYPSNNTGRVKVYYTFAGGQRVLQVRLDTTGTLLTDAVEALNLVLGNNRQAFTNDLVFTHAEHIPKDGDVATPFAWTPVTGNGGSALDPFYWPRFVSVVAKTYLGGAVKWSFYGIAGLPNDNSYRLLPNELPSIHADLLGDFLLFITSQGVVAADGAAVLPKTYLNIGYNAYYQRKRRRG
jgi:hypothetical protein